MFRSQRKPEPKERGCVRRTTRSGNESNSAVGLNSTRLKVQPAARTACDHIERRSRFPQAVKAYCAIRYDIDEFPPPVRASH